jgi:site-specific DNA recombinase
MARARIYIRRSDDDQSGYSPEAQDRESRRWCDQHDHEVVEVYTDDDLSGGKEGRESFQRMLRDAKADPGSVVVVHKFDRMARDTEVLLRVVYKELLPRRVKVYSVLESIDPYTPLGKAMLTVSGSFSTYYIDNLSTEVSKGYREKFERGGWIGPLPLGYKSYFEKDANGERIKGTGRAVFSEDIGTVRRIFEAYATGNYSDLSLAEELNAEGLTTIHKARRVPFQKDSIKTVLTNPFYIGLVTYQGEQRPGAHEAAIDRDLWDRCQAVRARRAGTPGGRLPIRGIGGLLSELVYCGKCGAKMHTLMCGSGASRQRYYRCSARRKFGTEVCDADFVRAIDAERQVLDVLRALTIPPALRDAVIAVVQKRLAQPASGQARDMVKLEAQLERLKELYELGDLEKADYLRKRKRVQDQLARATPPPTRTLDITRALDLLSSMSALLDGATLLQQRAVIQQVLTMIWIEKSAVTAIRPAHSYAIFVAAMWQKRPRRGSRPSMILRVFPHAGQRSASLWIEARNGQHYNTTSAPFGAR